LSPPEDPGRPGETAEEFAVTLANEYAAVEVRKVHTHNGVRLEIVAPRLGRGIRLCPLELETLSWQEHETFSQFLATPFGPEGEPES
jgi:hypothetical protein